MSRDHLSWKLAAYLDNRLSQTERQAVEAHVAGCHTCAGRLDEAQRLARNLAPALQQALGQPTPPPDLQQRLRRQLSFSGESRLGRPLSFGLLLSGLGTAAVIGLLVVSVLALIQARLSPPVAPIAAPTAQIVPPTASPPAPTTPVPPKATPTPLPATPTASTSASELATPADTQTSAMTETQTTLPTPVPATPTQTVTASNLPSRPVEIPVGWIAFAFYNPAPQRQTYEIHLIRPDGSDHHLFPLDGVSEPALHPTEADRLAYRAWGDPTGPRSLASGDLTGRERNQIGGFWEDAQPDWSPVEDRLLYASQREQDRRWRLYTSRGDGSEEINLPLAGQSPSFAPDGRRFVYEGCAAAGNHCGLWQATLDDKGATARPVLENPQAKSPDWSPTSEAIVYMAQVEGNWDLYLLDLASGETRRLTTDPASDGLPAWSPNGEWLAFLSQQGGDWGIWRYHLADGQIELIFAFDGGSFTPPATRYGERTWWDEQLSWGP